MEAIPLIERAIGLINNKHFSQVDLLCRNACQPRDPTIQFLQSIIIILQPDLISVPEHRQRSFALATACAAQHEPLGMFLLGVHLQRGIGVSKDASLAFQQYRNGAAYGCAPAIDLLGRAYIKGLGTPRDREKGASLCKRAADIGRGDAWTALAALHATLERSLVMHWKAITSQVPGDLTHDRDYSMAQFGTKLRKLVARTDGPRRVSDLISECVVQATRNCSYAEHLLARLDDDRARGDVVLVAGIQASDSNQPPYQQHRVHGHVLRLTSTFFDNYGKYEAPGVNTFTMHNCCDATVARLCAYLYTGRVTFASPDDALTLLRPAQYFVFDSLVQACSVYLTPRVCATNVLAVLELAECGLCQKLHECATRELCENLDLVAGTPAFKRLGRGDLESILQKRGMSCSDHKLGAILAWAGTDATRVCHAAGLIRASVDLDAVTSGAWAAAMSRPVLRNCSDAALLLLLANAMSRALHGTRKRKAPCA